MVVAGKKKTIRSNSKTNLLLILNLFLILSCTNNSIKQSKQIESIKVEVPSFNEDSAYVYIKKQVDFGPRVISSSGWKKCADWLEKEFKKYTANVIIQEAPVTTYDNRKHIAKNIIATFNPETNNRIALFAHWDTRHVADYDSINKTSPILGANDGGSGVGVLLEIARQLNNKKTKIGIDIILFDAEDYGQPENSKFPIVENSWCLGSQYWSKYPHKKNYYARYGILLDMVGAKNATFTYEATSVYFAENILDKVWSAAHDLGYSNYFIFQETKQILDDHYYVNTVASIPTIDIIEYDASTATNFNKHWHTHQDDMRNINKKTLKAVGQTLLEVIYNE